ncbi:MAG TPA: glycosyl hydrolase family 28 protein [Opitutaceae bacterium]|nr:glycosyl hydrolase family 28 protein [Opitutaceae bacterium]
MHPLPRLLALALASALPATAALGIHDITATGAVAGGATLDTAAIQASIDQCSAEGGGVVVVPPGTFLTGALFLKPGVTLCLQKGAVLKGSNRLEDYLPAGVPAERRGVEPWALINAAGLAGPVLEGEGTIDGNGRRWWDEYWKLRNARDPDLAFKTRRPRLVHFTDCRNVRVSGLTLRNQAVWCLHLQACADVIAEDLTIRADHDAPSSDGIDVDSCQRVRIRRCDIDVDDDCISIKARKVRDRPLRPCEDVTIEQCHFGYGHGGVGIGSETNGGIRRIQVLDCTADHGNRAPVRLKTMPSHGGVVEDVVFRHLRMSDVGQAFEINMDWVTGTSRPEAESNPPPVFRDIRLVDIQGTAEAVGMIRGLADSPVSGVAFQDCRIESPVPLVMERARAVDLAGLAQVCPPFPADVLLPGRDWEVAKDGLKGADGIAVDAKGEVFFCDTGNEKTYRIGLDGAVRPVLAESRHVTGQAFGPDGRLYATVGNDSSVVAYAEGGLGPARALATGFRGNDLVVAHSGCAYVTNPPPRGSAEPSRVWLIQPGDVWRMADSGIAFSNGITLSPDQATLYVSDSFSPWVYAFRIEPDGTLSNRRRFAELRRPPGTDRSGGDGMHADRAGRIYVASALGIQVCRPDGTVEGVIPVPGGHVVSVCLGGPRFDTLYAGCGGTLYRRKVRVPGANGWQEPQAPAAQ